MAKKDGFSLKDLFPIYNETYLQYYNYIGDEIILSVFTILFCIIGLVGNGYVIWLLGFRMKRKPFAIYILNLAVADFGTLVFLLPLDIVYLLPSLYEYLAYLAFLDILFIGLFLSMYSTCQLLVTAISIDRWVSVLFPNLYQSNQSLLFSTAVCASIWILTFALMGIPSFLYLMDFITQFYGYVFLGGYTAIWLTCLLLVIISTLTLVFKICLKSQQCQSGNLSKVILLVLLSFILFTILAVVSLILGYFILQAYIFLWISLRGSINPLIYYFAGRQNTGKFQERIMVILQRLFKEERDTRMELQPHTQTVL